MTATISIQGHKSPVTVAVIRDAADGRTVSLDTGEGVVWVTAAEAHRIAAALVTAASFEDFRTLRRPASVDEAIAAAGG